MCVHIHFCLCVHKKCMDMYTGKISSVFASVFGIKAWVTAWCRLLNWGYEWFPPPAKSCQSDGERAHHSIWTESSYKWGGHLCRKTDRRTDRQQTDSLTKKGKWQTNRSIKEVAASICAKMISHSTFSKDVWWFIIIIDTANGFYPNLALLLFFMSHFQVNLKYQSLQTSVIAVSICCGV